MGKEDSSLDLFLRENDRLARYEYPKRAGFFVGRRLEAFFDDARVIRKIEGIEPELLIFRAWQVDSHAVALHDTANVRRDFAQHIAQIEIRHHSIRQIQEQLQTFLRPLRRLKIEGVIHRQCDLVGDQRAEAHLFFGIGVAMDARNYQAAEAPVGGA